MKRLDQDSIYKLHLMNLKQTSASLIEYLEEIKIKSKWSSSKEKSFTQIIRLREKIDRLMGEHER